MEAQVVSKRYTSSISFSESPTRYVATSFLYSRGAVGRFFLLEAEVQVVLSDVVHEVLDFIGIAPDWATGVQLRQA